MIKKLNENWIDDMIDISKNNMKALGIEVPEISGEEAFTDNILCHIDYIMMQELNISEKDFRGLESLDTLTSKIYAESQQDINSRIKEYFENDLRYQFCAEELYQNFYKGYNLD